MCIRTLYTRHTQCIAYNVCITSQYTCYTLVLVYNKPFYTVHGQDIEVAGMMTHGVIVGIDDAEVMKQTDSCQ